MNLGDLDCTKLHEIVLYPRLRQPAAPSRRSGIEHDGTANTAAKPGTRPGDPAWPVYRQRPLEGYNLVIHELAHKLDAQRRRQRPPPLHHDMRVQDWASVMQSAYDDSIASWTPTGPDTEIDPYRAETRQNFSPSPANIFSAPRIYW